MNTRLCIILFWVGRGIAAASAVLIAYIMFNPAIAGPYGPGAGVFTVGLVGFFLWFLGRTAIYLIGEE